MGSPKRSRLGPAWLHHAGAVSFRRFGPSGDRCRRCAHQCESVSAANGCTRGRWHSQLPLQGAIRLIVAPFNLQVRCMRERVDRVWYNRPANAARLHLPLPPPRPPTSSCTPIRKPHARAPRPAPIRPGGPLPPRPESAPAAWPPLPRRGRAPRPPRRPQGAEAELAAVIGAERFSPRSSSPPPPAPPHPAAVRLGRGRRLLFYVMPSSRARRCATGSPREAAPRRRRPPHHHRGGLGAGLRPRHG